MLALVEKSQLNTVPYDEAVINGKKIMSEMENKQWELGELADKLEPKYGDQTLLKFAADIGLPYSTLKNYRRTFRAWEGKDRPRSFSVAHELNPLKTKEEIVRRTPDITRDEARAITKKMRAPKNENEAEETVVFPYQEECTDCNSAQEQWQRSVGNMLGDILSFRAYWDHLFGEDWKTFKIPASHIKLATDAEKELKLLVAQLRSHQYDPEN